MLVIVRFQDSVRLQLDGVIADLVTHRSVSPE